LPRRKKLPDRVFLTAAAAAVLFASPGVSAQGKVPPYPEALRCAALTNAAAKIGKGTPQESALFDHTIFWGMAASDAGRAAGKNAKAVEAEVARDGAAAEARLRAQDGATSAALAACVRQVPALNN
jgi:hypothetical protein